MDAMLVMFKADGSRHEFPLRKERIVIGRTVSCDLRVPLSSVSRQHCEVRVEGEALLIKDLGSSNGTFVNHTRVQESTLAAGDELVIGPIVFTLVVNGQPQDIKPVRSIIGRPLSEADAALPQALPMDDSNSLPAAKALSDPHLPTVDLDEESDDPLAALDAMVRAREDSSSQK